LYSASENLSILIGPNKSSSNKVNKVTFYLKSI